MEITWKACLIGFAVLLSAAGTATAQTTGQGYAIAGRGMYANLFSSGPVTQFGGGGEAPRINRDGHGGIGSWYHDRTTITDLSGPADHGCVVSAVVVRMI